MSERDFFKEYFKYYKKKNPPPNFDRVIDFDSKRNLDSADCLNIQYLQPTSNEIPCQSCEKLGLQNHQSWSVYSLKHLNGFMYIQNPFTPFGQQIWIRRCLEEYPRKPAVTNLDLHYKNVDDVWSSTDPEKQGYLQKLCWATLGYHHNWDTKVYDPNQRSEFPCSLESLSKHIAESLGFISFKPEAAIVNYYNSKSSLSIHNDHSEVAIDEPIISFSFGQTGVFLIGTEDKLEKPSAIFLRSGDIVIMSRSCRLSYHAVPCILKENVDDRYCESENNDWIEFHNYISKARINISVRQVYEN